MSASARLTAYFGADASQFNTVCDQVEGRLNTLTGAARSINISMADGTVGGINSAENAVAGLTGSVGQLIGTYVGVKLLGEAFDGLKDSVIGFNAMRESTMVGFTTQMKGDVKAAQSMMDELQKFAVPTPFRMADLAPLANEMMGFKLVMKDSATAGQQVVSMLRDIGDASFGLSAGQQGVDRLVLAFGQLKSAGQVNAHIMREFTTMGIDAWGYLAEATGKTTGEIRKMSEQGLIPADAAIKVLRAGIERDFGGAMQRATKTWDGAWAQMLDSAQIAFADGFKPLFNDMRDEALLFAQVAGSPEMTQWTSDLASKAEYALTFAKELFLALVEAVRAGNPFLVSAILLLGGRLLWLAGTAIIGAFLPAARAVIAAATTIGAAFLALSLPVQIAIVAVGLFAVAYGTNFAHVKDVTDSVVGFCMGQLKAFVQDIETVSWGLAKAVEWATEHIPGLKALIGDQTGLSDGVTKDFDGFIANAENKAHSLRTSFDKLVAPLKNASFKSIGSALMDAAEGLIPDLDKIRKHAEDASKAAEIPNGKPGDGGLPHIDLADPGAAKAAKKELSEAASAWNQYASAVESAGDRQIKTLDKLRDTLIGFVQELESKLLDAGGNMGAFYGLVGQIQKALPLNETELAIFDRSRAEGQEARDKSDALKKRADAIQTSGPATGASGRTGASDGTAATSEAGARIAENIIKKEKTDLSVAFHKRCQVLARTNYQESGVHDYDQYFGGSAKETMHNFQGAGIGQKYTPGMKMAPGGLLYSETLDNGKSGHVVTIGTDGGRYDQYGRNKIRENNFQWYVPPPGARTVAPKKAEAAPSASAPDSEAATQTAISHIRGLNARQTQTARTIIEVGRAMGASQKVISAALATALMESTMGVNVRNGHALGAFQQMPSWGSAQSRLNVSDSAKRFYARAIKADEKHPDLSVNDLAQKVQASDKPNGYARYAGQAQAILASAGGASSGGVASSSAAPVPLPELSAFGKAHKAVWQEVAHLKRLLDKTGKESDDKALTNAGVKLYNAYVKAGKTLAQIDSDALATGSYIRFEYGDTSATKSGDGPPKDAHAVKNESERPKPKKWTKYDPAEVGHIPLETPFNDSRRKAQEMLARNDTQEIFKELKKFQNAFPELKSLDIEGFKRALPHLAELVDFGEVAKKTRELKKETKEFSREKDIESTSLRNASAAMYLYQGNALEAGKADQIGRFEAETRKKLQIDELQRNGMMSEAKRREGLLTQQVTAFTRTLNVELRSQAFASFAKDAKSLDYALQDLTTTDATRIAQMGVARREDAGYLSDLEKRLLVSKQVSLEEEKALRATATRLTQLRANPGFGLEAAQSTIGSINEDAYKRGLPRAAVSQTETREILFQARTNDFATSLDELHTKVDEWAGGLQVQVGEALNKTFGEGVHPAIAQATRESAAFEAQLRALVPQFEALAGDSDTGAKAFLADFASGAIDSKGLADGLARVSDQNTGLSQLGQTVALLRTELAGAMSSAKTLAKTDTLTAWNEDFKDFKEEQFAPTQLLRDWEAEKQRLSKAGWTDAQLDALFPNWRLKQQIPQAQKWYQDFDKQKQLLTKPSGPSRDLLSRKIDLQNEGTFTDDQIATILAKEKWMTQMQSIAQGLDQTIGDTIHNLMKNGLKDWKNLFSGLENIFDDWATNILKNQVWSALTSALGGIAGIGGGAGGNIAISAATHSSGGVVAPHGSHADGLAYVPFDGYIGQLHRGERVLTATENSSLPMMMSAAMSQMQRAQRLANQSGSLVSGVVAASQLSSLSSSAHVAAATSKSGNANGGSAGSGEGGQHSYHIQNLHVHGVQNADEVPGALAGAMVSQREATRHARRALSYGQGDD